MENVKKAYDEIFKYLNKHKGIIALDVDDLQRKSDIHLFGLDLKETHGLDIDVKRVGSLDWVKFGDYKMVSWFGPKYNRSISWSVDGRQPKDELLFFVSFSTGAYIFGGDYPVEFFQKFWLELKSFNPDYIDEANHSIYWKIENAKIPFNEFDSVLKKYNELNREDIKKRRIEEMRLELERLEKN